MELEGNSNSTTSVAFLRQLRARHTEPLTVIWENSPARRGDALRAYLATPGLNLHLVNLPTYSPDFNADEAVWGWVRQDATANLCLGTLAAVQEKVGDFFASLSKRREEVKHRCRTALQARAVELTASEQADLSRHLKCRFHLGFGLALEPYRAVDRIAGSICPPNISWGVFRVNNPHKPRTWCSQRCGD